MRVVDLFRECGEQYHGIKELLEGYANEDLTFISSSSGNKLLEVSNGMFDDEDDEDRDDCSPKKKARVRRSALLK